ncbi:hypothetical protein BC829DRAFT_25096 [Chytridium lagenaria]|nr:hypothetical protein BC829DRAFT_25096 [Chytridium lagenaria]
MEIQIEPSNGSLFLLDLGKSGEAQITGTLIITNPTSTPLKDATISLNLRGSSEFSFRDRTKMHQIGTPLLALTQTFDTPIKPGDTRLPFTFTVPPLKRPMLLPSLRIDGANVFYELRAVGTWKNGLMKKVKEVETEVVGMTPEGVRARTLALQAPLSVRGPKALEPPKPFDEEDDESRLSMYKAKVESPNLAYHMIVRRR